MIYVTLFAMFFRIGLFSFGGGLAMLPLIFQSVKDFGMMTTSEFSDLVALSQVTPGPIAVNAATYVGFNGAGIPGALAATLGVALPSFDTDPDRSAVPGAVSGEQYRYSGCIPGNPPGNSWFDCGCSPFRGRNSAGQWSDHFCKTLYRRRKLF